MKNSVIKSYKLNHEDLTLTITFINGRKLIMDFNLTNHRGVIFSKSSLEERMLLTLAMYKFDEETFHNALNDIR